MGNEKFPTCLWFSGGSDSTLLLFAMLEIKKPFGILRFDDGWSREQKREVDALIIEKNLQVFSYPPIDSFLVSEGDEIGLVSRYSVSVHSGNTMNLIRDVVDDPKVCAFDLMLEKAKQKAAPIVYCNHILGVRKDDTHWSSGEKSLIPGRHFSNETGWVYCPLYDWKREDVNEALKVYNVPEFTSDSDIHACTKCLQSKERVFCPKVEKEIDPVEWDAPANLKFLRSLL